MSSTRYSSTFDFKEKINISDQFFLIFDKLPQKVYHNFSSRLISVAQTSNHFRLVTQIRDHSEIVHQPGLLLFPATCRVVEFRDLIFDK